MAQENKQRKRNSAPPASSALDGIVAGWPSSRDRWPRGSTSPPSCGHRLAGEIREDLEGAAPRSGTNKAQVRRR
jgi:hypothetical protein